MSTGTASYSIGQIRERATKRLPCPTCGRPVPRQRIFGRTLWAFSTPKPDHVIRAEVRSEVDRWKQRPEPCPDHSERT